MKACACECHTCSVGKWVRVRWKFWPWNFHFLYVPPLLLPLILRPRSSLSMPVIPFCLVQLCKPIIMPCLPLSQVLSLHWISGSCWEEGGAFFHLTLFLSLLGWVSFLPLCANCTEAMHMSSWGVLWLQLIRPDPPIVVPSLTWWWIEMHSAPGWTQSLGELKTIMRRCPIDPVHCSSLNRSKIPT